MKKSIGLLFIIFVLTGGCLDVIFPEKVPVLNLNIKLEETPNGEIRMIELSAQGDEMSKLNAPQGQIPNDIPGFYVDLLQDSFPVSYKAGMDYTGPGHYNFTLGLKPEFNKSNPIVISTRVLNREGNYKGVQHFVINWSTDLRSKTFMYE